METRVYNLDSIINFGKYKGKSIFLVLQHDASYLIWAHNNVEWFKLTHSVYEVAYDKASDEKRQYYIDNLDPIDYYDYCGGDDY